MEDNLRELRGYQLKAEGYKQALAEREEQNMDLRVQLTLLHEDNESLKAKVQELEATVLSYQTEEANRVEETFEEDTEIPD